MVLLVFNPKAYVIIELMFSQFLPVGKMETIGAILLIGTVFTLNNLVAFMVWELVGDILAGVTVWMLVI